jgi:hypothetical protein
LPERKGVKRVTLARPWADDIGVLPVPRANQPSPGGEYHMRIKLILAALTAALLLACVTGGATARNLSISHGALFFGNWSQIRFTNGGSTAAACDLTLEGSFHYRTFFKVTESLVGYITRAIANNCTSGSATVLGTNLPWHIRYHSFEGTLPNITAITFRLILVEIRIHEGIFGTDCLSRTTSAEPWGFRMNLSAGRERRVVTDLAINPNFRIRCGIINESVEGVGRAREIPGGSENILVRLI